MNDYEILNDFIDGELPQELESELFAALNANEELRNLMKRTIALNKAAKSPALTSRPTPELTNALFGKLGITTAPETAMPKLVDGNEKRRFLPMFATVAAVFLAILALMVSRNETAGTISQAGRNFASISINKGFPVIASTEIPANSFSPKDTIVKYVYVRKDGSNNNEISNKFNGELIGETSGSVGKVAGLYDFSHFIELPNGYPYVSLIPLKPPLKKRNDIIPIDTTNLQFVQNDDAVNQDNQFGLTVEFRGSQNWLNPEPNIEPEKKALFNNSSFAMMYYLSEELALGAEIRQENFFQKYQGYDRLYATESIYEQQPNFTSGGIFARYSYNELGFIRPFVQLTGGGNETGVIGRGMAGLILKPLNNVSIIFGYEYSRLYYNHLQQGFTSDKKSFNYGMSYTF